MESTSDPTSPFRDPSIQSSEASVPASSATAASEAPDITTLVLNRDASLTLGTDSLVILDQALTRSRNYLCCGIIPGKRNPATRAIPFFNILWAELNEIELSIQYAHHVTKESVRVANIHYTVDKSDRAFVMQWVDLLMNRAYGRSQRHKRIKVLINPFGGAGRAQSIFLQDIDPILQAARCTVDVEKTQRSGHAVEIAENLNIDAYDVVAACSGDGVPHEIFNGFGKRPDAAQALAKVAVVQLPCGTGNAMSWSLNGTDSPSLAALCLVKGLRTPLDLVSITQEDRRTLSFLSQAVGIVAESDLGTENIRWMGDARFTYGFLIRLLRKTIWPCDIAVGLVDDDKASIKSRYQAELAKQHDNSKDASFAARGGTNVSGLPALRFGTVNDPLPASWVLTPYETLGNFYAGNMPFMAADTNFFQAALPSDGCLDLVCIDGRCKLSRSIGMLLAVGQNKLFNVPEVSYRKVNGYRIVPKPKIQRKEEYISVDGERYPFAPYQVEVHQGLGTALSRNGRFYEAPPLP